MTMSLPVRRAVALLLLFGLAGCTRSRGISEPDALLSTRVAGATVELSNRTDQPVYYVAFESELATRIRFAPCADPEACASVAPGRTRTIPLAEVAGYHPRASSVIVYFWHLVPAAEGMAVERMSSLVLPVGS